MRAVAYIWGVGGVLLLLGSAIYRLAPMTFALKDYPLSPFHWCALVLFVVYMAYAEGYKGFHLAFAPRVVSSLILHVFFPHNTQTPAYLYRVELHDPVFCPDCPSATSALERYSRCRCRSRSCLGNHVYHVFRGFCTRSV